MRHWLCSYSHVKRPQARIGRSGEIAECTFDTVDRVGALVNSAQARERIGSALDAIDAAHDVLRRTSSDSVGNAFRVGVAERLEAQDRTNRGLMHRVFGEIADPPDRPGRTGIGCTR